MPENLSRAEQCQKLNLYIKQKTAATATLHMKYIYNTWSALHACARVYVVNLYLFIINSNFITYAIVVRGEFLK